MYKSNHYTLIEIDEAFTAALSRASFRFPFLADGALLEQYIYSPRDELRSTTVRSALFKAHTKIMTTNGL